MKTVAQRLQEAYDWYLQTWVENIYASQPMGYDEWVDVTYNYLPFGERFAPKDVTWAYSKLGSLQADMERAFEEHEKAQFLPTEDEERDLNRFQYCRTHRDNPLYFAKEYVQMMSEGKYDRMARILQCAVKRLNNKGLTEFNQYVRDLVMTTI